MAISTHAPRVGGDLEIDILNFIFFVNGVDYLADVRKALGK